MQHRHQPRTRHQGRAKGSKLTSPSSSSASAGATDTGAIDLSRRLGKWLAITAVFGVVPVLFDAIILYSRNADITMSALFSDASIYLIGFSICAAGFGDALFDRKFEGDRLDGLTITAVFASALMLAVGAVLYAANKSLSVNTEGDWRLPLVYVVCATAVSFATVRVAAR